MDLVRFVEHAKPKVQDPVFVEGLPGVGNVGKLACDHLVDELGATLWCDIFSYDFPPQVTIQADGTVHLVRCQLWSAPRAAANGKEKRDVVLMTGDYQPLSSQGQYALVEGVLERILPLGCKELYTLGGYGVGTRLDEPGVLGAATDKAVVERLEKLGVRFEEDEPGGGIIGASGLFLGLGKENGMQGACLMGETSGYMVDPKAAGAVIDTLSKIMGLGEIDLAALDEKAKELDRIAAQLQEAESAAMRGSDSDLHYIG